MNLAAKRIDELPPLAWLAALPNGSASGVLLHGRSVEHFANGFFEGAWEGQFAAAGFDRAVNVFGSGGKLGADSAIFVSPSHVLEPLYIASTDRMRAVANSLPFLLHHCGLEFNPKNTGYGVLFSAIVGGLEATPLKMPLDGGVLMLVHHHNAVLSQDGGLVLVPKPLPPRLPKFSDYVAYLRGVTAGVFQNANDPSRKHRYLPVATITSGYDSGATAVVARACGCSDSVGLSTSNKGRPDSGKVAAGILGLNYTEFAGMPRATGSGLAEAEFLAPGMQGEDLFFSAFSDKLRGRILTTGIYGGVVWNKHHSPAEDLHGLDLSGCSLGEFRLRNDFLHLPIAFIGGQRWPDIHRISNAPDMAAFSVGGYYDRPVPRRILEEAGVPRAIVARVKNAASILLFQGRSRFSPAARASIAAYCKRKSLYYRYLLAFYPQTLWWMAGRTLYGLLRRLGRLLKEGRLRQGLARFRNAVCKSLFRVEGPVFGASHPRFTILLTWAISELDGRYASAGRYVPQDEIMPARAVAE